MLLLHSLFFFFYCYRAHRDLHSFPTRRSSDLASKRLTSSAGIPPSASLYRPSTGALMRGIRLNASTPGASGYVRLRSEEHTSELQSHSDLVCRLLLEKKKNKKGSRMRTSYASP